MKASVHATIQIVLVDDHVLFREGMARLLTAEKDLELVAHCARGDDAVKLLSTARVDVVLLDLDLGNERGVEVLERLRANGFAGHVLVLTAGASDVEIPKLFALGVAGIFYKENSAEMLAEAIRTVMRGDAWLDQRSLAALSKARAAPPSGSDSLTQRERQVLRGVFDGLANKEIGARLQVSEGSIKATLQQLFSKTGVRTRSQLVRIVLERYRGQV